MDMNMLFQLIGEKEVEKRLLLNKVREAEATISQMTVEQERLRDENAAMAAQIGADHGEPT